MSGSLNGLSHHINQDHHDDANGFNLFVWDQKQMLVAIVTHKNKVWGTRNEMRAVVSLQVTSRQVDHHPMGSFTTPTKTTMTLVVLTYLLGTWSKGLVLLWHDLKACGTNNDSRPRLSPKSKELIMQCNGLSQQVNQGQGFQSTCLGHEEKVV
jgi:hypothetical protein